MAHRDPSCIPPSDRGDRHPDSNAPRLDSGRRQADAGDRPDSGEDVYVPIACSVHDRLEAAAVRRIACRLRVRSPDGREEEHTARIRDILVRNGAEYAVLSSGEEVRLDRLTLLQD